MYLFFVKIYQNKGLKSIYFNPREMEILSRNYPFFVDHSKIIQSFSIWAWMSNVWSSNELWISGIIWYLFGIYFRYIWVLAPKEYVHTRPAIQPIQIPRHLLLLTVILEPVRRKLQVILLIFTTIWTYLKTILERTFSNILKINPRGIFINKFRLVQTTWHVSAPTKLIIKSSQLFPD